MAHFAQLDENNTVLQVLVIGNDDTSDENGNEVEAIGVEFCKSLFGADTIWKQTSYNHNFRLQYAAVGGFYDPDRDAFYPAPHEDYPSWVLNYDNGMYEPPIPHPDGTYVNYDWDEENQTWIFSPDPE